MVTITVTVTKEKVLHRKLSRRQFVKGNPLGLVRSLVLARLPVARAGLGPAQGRILNGAQTGISGEGTSEVHLDPISTHPRPGSDLGAA